MNSELSQTQTGDENELETREWGQEFILYDGDDPGKSWVSINENDLVNLDETR